MLPTYVPHLVVALALCHLAVGWRIYFPENDNGADYRPSFEQQRRPNQNELFRDERQVDVQPSRSNPVSSNGRPSQSRIAPKVNEVAAKRVVAKPAPRPPVEEFTNEELEFDDYWAEDNLKAEQSVKKSPSACVWAIISCCKPSNAAPAPSGGRNNQQAPRATSNGNRQAAPTSRISLPTSGRVTIGADNDFRGNQQVRYNCFEAMNCHGAFWDVNPCSRSMMQAALQSTAEFYNVKPN